MRAARASSCGCRSSDASMSTTRSLRSPPTCRDGTSTCAASVAQRSRKRRMCRAVSKQSPAKRQFKIFVDYAHTDDALLNVIQHACASFAAEPAHRRFRLRRKSRQARNVRKWARSVDRTRRLGASSLPTIREKKIPRRSSKTSSKVFAAKNYEAVVPDRKRGDFQSRVGRAAAARYRAASRAKATKPTQEFAYHIVPFDDVHTAIVARPGARTWKWATNRRNQTYENIHHDHQNHPKNAGAIPLLSRRVCGAPCGFFRHLRLRTREVTTIEAGRMPRIRAEQPVRGTDFQKHKVDPVSIFKPSCSWSRAASCLQAATLRPPKSRASSAPTRVH